MARSFHAMHSMVFAMRSMGLGSRGNTSDVVRETIYIRCAKKHMGYRFSDV